MACSIGEFHCQHYMPLLQKYAHQRQLIPLLGQYGAKQSRKEAFVIENSVIMADKDYAATPKAEFNNEIQLEAFGYNRTLSMGGSSLTYYDHNDINNTTS